MIHRFLRSISVTIFILSIVCLSGGIEADGYMLIGDYFLEIGDYENAVNNYSISLLQHTNELILNRIGFAYYLNNSYTSAQRYYNLALTFNSNVSYVYNNLGVLEYNSGNYHQALVYYRKALELNPYYARVMANMAVVYFKLGQYAKSYSYYQMAKRTDEQYVEERLDKEKGKRELAHMAAENPDDEELQRIYQYVMSNY